MVAGAPTDDVRGRRARRFRRSKPTPPDRASGWTPTIAAEIEADQEGLEDQVLELRAIRARLVRELAYMEDRVDRLEQMTVVRGRSVDVDRLAEVHDKLRRAAEALQSAHHLRDIVSGELVTRSFDPVVIQGEPALAARRRRLVLYGLGVLAAAGLGAGAAALALDEDDATAPQRPAAAASPAPAPAASLPPCSALPADAGANGADACTTGTILSIAAGTRPVLLRDTEARVQRIARDDAGAVLRMRIRNRTGEAQSLDGRLYLSLRGQRIYGSARPAGASVPARGVRTLSVRFLLDPSVVGRVDLGVVPFAEPLDAAPRRLGVIRLTLPAA